MNTKTSVLIVDDEMLARLGIRSMVAEMPDYCVVGEAGSADVAVGLVRQLRPKIVLTDIVMPGMDGLDMIRLLSREAPGTRFIILSCVEKVPALQEAILLGVSGYLIKHALTKGELQMLLNKARAESERLWDAPDLDGMVVPEAHAARLLQSLMYAQNSAAATVQALTSLGIDLSTPPLHVVAADLPPGAPDATAYCRVANELLNAMAHGAAFLDADGRLCIAVTGASTDSAEFCQGLTDRLHSTFMQYFDADICFGISEPLASCEDVPKGYAQALKMKDSRYYGGNRASFSHVGCASAQRVWQAAREKTEAVLNACASRDLSGCVIDIEALAQLLRESTLLSPQEVQLLLTPIFHAIMAARGVGDRFLGERKTTLTEYVCGFDEFEALIEALMDLLDEDEPSAGYLGGAMEHMAAYLKEHCREKITLDAVARLVHMSPHYACRCFKRAKGMTIMDFAMQCRIEEAIAMLRDGTSVSETSHALGFCSEGHFIRVFKKMQGTTPGRFARKCMQP